MPCFRVATAELSPGIASATESPINVTCWIVSARDPPAAGVLAAKAVAATSAATKTVTPRIGADGTEGEFGSRCVAHAVRLCNTNVA